jgi:hypothetical protein
VNSADAGRSDLDAILPIDLSASFNRFVTNSTTLTITNPVHPITQGVGDQFGSYFGESSLAGADPGAKVLGTFAGQPGVVTKQVGSGTGVWLSPAYPWFYPALTAGNADRLLEQAMAFAAPTGAGVAVLEIQDASGNLLASGVGANNLDAVIQGFQAPASDTYFVRVGVEGDYSLVVTRDAVFDAEENDSAATAVSLNGVGGALSHGAIGYLSGDPDLSAIIDFDGPVDFRFQPPDPIIAAGPDSLVTMVNTQIAAYEKDGTLKWQQDLSYSGGFFGEVGATTTVFDPWILYDDDSDRFFAIGIDIESSSLSNVYLAVSQDDSPDDVDDWYKYQIDRTGVHEIFGSPTFPDYPKMGVDEDAIYIAENHFGISVGGFSHGGLAAIEKAPLLSGGPANILYDEVVTDGLTPGLEGISIFPVLMHDPSASEPMYFAESSIFNGNQVRIHALENVLTTPVRTTFDVTVPAYLTPPNIPQQGSSSTVDSIDARIMTGVWRDGSLWTAHASGVDGGGRANVQWFEFDVRDFPQGGSPSLVQSDFLDLGPGINTFMPHINVDDDGDMGLGFSRGAATEFLSVGYTGRLASDPLGTTRPAQTLVTSTSPYNGFRWGDYSGLALDPTDGETFWLFNEYATGTFTWNTRVASFSVDPGVSEDWYELTIPGGATDTALVIDTGTKADGPGEFVNTLDPTIELYDATGTTLLASGIVQTDGRNELFTYSGISPGDTFLVKVSNENETAGEYFVGVRLLREKDPDSQVDDGFPVNNEDDGIFRVAPGQGWTPVSDPLAYKGDYVLHQDDVEEKRSNYAKYRIRATSPTPELFATWVADSGNATNATYEVYYEGILLTTKVVDQTRAPNDALLFGTTLGESLGVFDLLATGRGYNRNAQLEVRLITAGADGNVVADAVFDPPSGAVQRLSDGGLYSADPLVRIEDSVATPNAAELPAPFASKLHGNPPGDANARPRGAENVMPFEFLDLAIGVSTSDTRGLRPQLLPAYLEKGSTANVEPNLDLVRRAVTNTPAEDEREMWGAADTLWDSGARVMRDADVQALDRVFSRMTDETDELRIDESASPLERTSSESDEFVESIVISDEFAESGVIDVVAVSVAVALASENRTAAHAERQSELRIKRRKAGLH